MTTTPRRRPTAKRDWALISRLGRARRAEEARGLRQSVLELERQLTELLERHGEVHDKKRRQSEKNMALKAEVGKLLANAARAEPLFAQNRRQLETLTNQFGRPDALPLVYSPSIDDPVFIRLEERHIKQYQSLERMVTGQTDPGKSVQRLIGEQGEPQLDMVVDRLVPFPHDVVAAGIRHVALKPNCVCRSHPIELSSTRTSVGTCSWVKMRHWLRDIKTGNRFTLICRVVVSYVTECERSLALWTATSCIEPDFTHPDIPEFETNELSWCLMKPADGYSTERSDSQVTHMRIHHLFSMQAAEEGGHSKELVDLVLSGLQEMLQNANQDIENAWCDELTRRRQHQQ